MSEEYRTLWSQLGLDLEAHDALLKVLGQAYQDIYLAQRNRPAAMSYFDFVMTEVHGLRVKELNEARAAGRKVIGSFCVFVPEELILAVDGISVGLCAGAEFGFDLAEQILPRNTCALIKSAFGFKLGKVCPYMESADMIVGENTCDGKKKAYEEFSRLVNNLYVLDLPQMKSEAGKDLLKTEYRKFMKALEDLAGKTITVAGLQAAIHTVNEKRRAMRRLAAARAAEPAPISGLDALLANQLFFFDDPARFTASINKLADELEQRAKKGIGAFPPGRPRVIVSGCPMAIPNWKVPMVIEAAGAVVVGEESCVGERGTRWMTSEEGKSVEDLLDNVVERYLNIDCAIFTPNPSRLEQVRKMVKDYQAQGVIHYCLQFCQPYQMESGNMVRELEKAGVRALALDTDYSQEDAGQLKTRIEAFLEMIK
jgi:benzoyl-CoA reductase/2-hydroxyglutaryl-CoA dehydratase subunit BcrC/BadD/HgdB